MKKFATLPKPIRSKDPVAILTAVCDAIREEPKRYDQGTYLEQQAGNTVRGDDYFPQCGTVCCVAGWVNILTGARDRTYEHQRALATETLKLEYEEASELFDAEPDDVRLRHDVTPRQHAADGIKHIKRFVLKKWGKKI